MNASNNKTIIHRVQRRAKSFSNRQHIVADAVCFVGRRLQDVYQQKFPALSLGPVRGRGAVMEVFKAASLLGRDAFRFGATAGQC